MLLLGRTFVLMLVTSLCCNIRQVSCVNDWWMDLPYDDQSSFNIDVELNDDVSVPCNDSNVPPGMIMSYWIRPDVKVMFPGESFRFFTLDGYASWTVNTTTNAIDIHILQENMFGFYYCVMSDGPTNMYVVKKAINYEKAYWGDLWEKYGKATIIGLIAAGSLLIVCIALLLVCKFFYKEEDDVFDHATSKNSSRSPSIRTGKSDLSSNVSQGHYDLEEAVKDVMTLEVHENPVFEGDRKGLGEGTSGLASTGSYRAFNVVGTSINMTNDTAF